MHVKYASRHALYPVPKVLDAVAVMDAARARPWLDVAARLTLVLMAPLRAVVGVPALRAVVAVRADVVAIPFRAAVAEFAPRVLFVVARDVVVVPVVR